MSTDITGTAAWKNLDAHHRVVESAHLRDLFAQDPSRGTELTVTAGDLYVDYSNIV